MTVLPATPSLTKIPVLGGAPFNTLVIVSGVASHVPVSITEFGKEEQQIGTFQSQYVLPDYDRKGFPVAAAHSTTAWFSTIGPTDKPGPLSQVGQHFLYSIDDVSDAGFDKDGTFSVNLNFSILTPPPPADDLSCIPVGPFAFCAYNFSVWVTSYLLVYETPSDDNQLRRLAETDAYFKSLPSAGRMKPVVNPWSSSLFANRQLVRLDSTKSETSGKKKCGCGNSGSTCGCDDR